MKWKAVIASLRREAAEAVGHAMALSSQLEVSEVARKTIERHKINANFCIALADALEAGLSED